MKDVYRTYDDLPIVISATQLSAILGISKSQAYMLLHSSGFPTFSVGKRLLVTKERLIDWLEQQTQ